MASLAVIVAACVWADEAKHPAAATDTPAITNSDPCARHHGKHEGMDMVFADGSRLSQTVGGIRCTLRISFDVRGLDEQASIQCIGPDGQITATIVGTQPTVKECRPNELLVTAASAHALAGQIAEVRWFTLAMGLAKSLYASNDISLLVCTGGYVVRSQPALGVPTLIEALRQMGASQETIDMVLAGVWLAENHRSYTKCITPQFWHRSEDSNNHFAAGPGVSGATPFTQNLTLFQKMHA